MFSYRSLLKQAWDITWKHKYLWFFGLFASLVAGSGTWEYQVLTQNIGQTPANGYYFHLGGLLTAAELGRQFLLGLVSLFQYDLLTIISGLSILILTGALIFIFVWLAIVSQAALINGIKKINGSRKKDLTLKISDSLAESHYSFWSLLGLNILMKLLISAAFFIVALPLLFMAIEDTALLGTIYVILFVIFIPVAMSLSLMVKYAIAYQVLENKPTMKALEMGEKLFRRNWLVSLETAVILFIISFLSSGVILAALILPFLILLSAIILKIYWLIILTLILAIIIIIVFGSALTTYQTAMWTSLFLRLKDKGALAKLERLFLRR